MTEVTREIFTEIVSKIPYKVSFLLGKNGIRYEGKGRKFKNALFAMQENERYYVIKILVS